ncbi:hypothetical protein O181_010920 [Austropuccinia psidii MF-1]|uniref:Integrase catalytic domain-containing protein n=1 Tax=Austropuccinia psidii MF-1 TaxID=1389203 RepID=A0A9Q3GLE2_9BASI|nr:hypothetical protein [Austropuccinia psidii MF-1]
MIRKQEPNRPWENFHMDWVTGPQKGGYRSYNSFLVIVDRFSQTSIFLPCHKAEKAMDTTLLIWNRVVSWTDIFINIISERDSKFTSEPCANIHQLSGTNLSLSTACHPQNDGLSERVIQTLEDMVRRFCAHGLEIKDFYGFKNDWSTLLPAMELAYKTSVHASTNKTPVVIEKGWNPILPQDSLRNDLVKMHLTASSFKGMIEKAIKHALRGMDN